MLKYQQIKDENMLAEFVEHLNSLPVSQKQLLFSEAFQPRILELRDPNFKNTNQNHVQKWWFSVNKFPVYAYVKIDMKLPIKRPDLKSGMYEQIYFTTNTNDFSGISHKQT